MALRQESESTCLRCENPGFRHGQLVPAAAVREVLAVSANHMQAENDARAFLRWLKTQSDGKKPVQGAQAQPVRPWELFEIVSKTRVRYRTTSRGSGSASDPRRRAGTEDGALGAPSKSATKVLDVSST